MAAGMSLVSFGRHRGSQPRFWTMVRWMATPYLGGFSNFPMAGRDIAADTCQTTSGVSRTWPGCWLQRGGPPRKIPKWKCAPQCTFTQSGAILSSSWPSLSFELMANQVFCRSCGYIPHVCKNGQWWMLSNAAQIPGFTKSLCICNYTQSGRDRPKSYSSNRCSNISEVQGIEWAAAGIYTSCPARAKPSTTHMVTEYGPWWLW